MFTLKQGECFGACGDSPVVLVNNKRMCSWMRPEELDRLLAELAAEAATVNAPAEFLDYGPDAIIMAGLNGRNWELSRLRRARRVRAR